MNQPLNAHQHEFLNRMERYDDHIEGLEQQKRELQPKAYYPGLAGGATSGALMGGLVGKVSNLEGMSGAVRGVRIGGGALIGAGAGALGAHNLYERFNPEWAEKSNQIGAARLQKGVEAEEEMYFNRQAHEDLNGLYKVANNLQLAYDQYKNSGNRMNQLETEANTLGRQYEDLSPKNEGLQMGAAFAGTTALGAGAGIAAGKKLLGSRGAGGLVGGTIGLAAGGLASRGVRSYNDKKHPDRVPVREQYSDKLEEHDNEMIRFNDRQDDLISAGVRNPSAVRAMLNPADTQDAWTDAMLSGRIREMRDQAESMRQARLNQAESQAAVNYSQHGLNAQQLYR